MQFVSILPEMLGTDGDALLGTDGDFLLSPIAETLFVPDFDLTTILPLGFVRTRALDDALMTAWAQNLYQPLTEAQILAVTGTPPAPLTSLPRLWRDETDSWAA